MLANIEARQMDGQALDLPDAAFDAVVSVFGVMLFPDWRAGLREMARVTRSGGSAAIAVWKSADGAAVHLLLSQVIRRLYPEKVTPMPCTGLAELADPDRLSAAVVAAGFADPVVTEVTRDFELNVGNPGEHREIVRIHAALERARCGPERGSRAHLPRRDRTRTGWRQLRDSSTALIASTVRR